MEQAIITLKNWDPWYAEIPRVYRGLETFLAV